MAEAAETPIEEASETSALASADDAAAPPAADEPAVAIEAPITEHVVPDAEPEPEVAAAEESAPAAEEAAAEEPVVEEPVPVAETVTADATADELVQAVEAPVEEAAIAEDDVKAEEPIVTPGLEPVAAVEGILPEDKLEEPLPTTADAETTPQLVATDVKIDTELESESSEPLLPQSAVDDGLRSDVPEVPDSPRTSH